MTSTTKKLLLGAILIVAIGGYIFWSSSQNSAAAPVTTTDTSAPSETTNPNSDPTPATSGTTASSGTYKDGTYTGAPANSIYGNVQVSATITGGKISDVTFLQSPNSQPHSIDVSNMSMPVLKSEAIASQSANVSVVSGATQTSEAFVQTMQSALSQAQA